MTNFCQRETEFPTKAWKRHSIEYGNAQKNQVKEKNKVRSKEIKNFK